MKILSQFRENGLTNLSVKKTDLTQVGSMVHGSLTESKRIISGYSLFGEGTPRLVHPIMSMNEYTKESQVKNAIKYADIQGRPHNMFYFSPVTYSGTGYFYEKLGRSLVPDIVGRRRTPMDAQAYSRRTSSVLRCLVGATLDHSRSG